VVLGWQKNPIYTHGLVLQVDKLCRDMPNKAVADWIACTTGRSSGFCTIRAHK
jgi:hypothetical protein